MKRPRSSADNAPNPSPGQNAQTLDPHALEVAAGANQGATGDMKNAHLDPQPGEQRAAKSGAKVPVTLLYDTWNDREERVPAGTKTDLPIEDAKRLIRERKAERADPLPGE